MRKTIAISTQTEAQGTKCRRSEVLKNDGLALFHNLLLSDCETFDTGPLTHNIHILNGFSLQFGNKFSNHPLEGKFIYKQIVIFPYLIHLFSTHPMIGGKGGNSLTLMPVSCGVSD
ncbi:hypothetical protein [Pseudophaeobacter leonis]|uniref:hypothetical protein n=1 Tax=Pseudophaeobacter leonis TaxID=1144477 RepID=UPI00111BDD0A|nr:hypothetical protein [Pseudophaeobacter leonis]